MESQVFCGVRKNSSPKGDGSPYEATDRGSLLRRKRKAEQENGRLFRDRKTSEIKKCHDLLEHPDILEDIPVLKIEYNDNGSRKPLKQIFEEFLVSMGEKENRIGNYDIYKHIFFSRAGIEPEQLESLKQVQIPEDLPDSVKRAVTKLREIVVSREIPTQTIDEVEEKDDLELE